MTRLYKELMFGVLALFVALVSMPTTLSAQVAEPKSKKSQSTESTTKRMNRMDISKRENITIPMVSN